MERVESYVEKCKNTTSESVFTGRMLELLGIELATIFISVLTFSIAYPWMLCWKQSWYADHTYINGKQMRFDGTGGQLIGSWLKWILLTIITLGIYLLWLPIKVQQWTVKHTYFEGEHDKESKFTGSMLGLWGIEIIGALVTICTLGIAWPWMWCWQANWYREHTIISGKQLHFNGKGGQFLGNWLKWMLLIFITFGIYILWFPIRIERWAVKHTYSCEDILRVSPAPPFPDDSNNGIKVCPGCKAKLNKDVAFCRFCGASLGENEPILLMPEPKPEPEHNPTPSTKKICPQCKREQNKNADFCRFCGEKLEKSESKLLTASEIVRRYEKRGETLSVEQVVIGPTPAGGAYAIQRKNDTWIEITEYDINDNEVNRTHGSISKKPPVNERNGKMICPHCGARHTDGTEKCKYCGTSMDGTQLISDTPEPSPDPKPDPTPVPAPAKKSKKVICPHCGARQQEDSVRCKYCGTSIR